MVDIVFLSHRCDHTTITVTNGEATFIKFPFRVPAEKTEFAYTREIGRELLDHCDKTLFMFDPNATMVFFIDFIERSHALVMVGRIDFQPPVYAIDRIHAKQFSTYFIEKIKGIKPRHDAVFKQQLHSFFSPLQPFTG